MLIHNKTIILGKAYSLRKNKRAKKENSYTIKVDTDSIKYALIEYFISIENHQLAAITVLNTQKCIPCSISPEHITLESQLLLFEGYSLTRKKHLHLYLQIKLLRNA